MSSRTARSLAEIPTTDIRCMGVPRHRNTTCCSPNCLVIENYMDEMATLAGGDVKVHINE
jgi:hypothetical protein